MRPPDCSFPPPTCLQLLCSCLAMPPKVALGPVAAAHVGTLPDPGAPGLVPVRRVGRALRRARDVGVLVSLGVAGVSSQDEGVAAIAAFEATAAATAAAQQLGANAPPWAGTLLAAINARFAVSDNAINARFAVSENAMNARFNAVDARFNAVDARLDAVDARLRNIEARQCNAAATVGPLQPVFTAGAVPQGAPASKAALLALSSAAAGRLLAEYGLAANPVATRTQRLAEFLGVRLN